jgi:WD40 repeat protein
MVSNGASPWIADLQTKIKLLINYPGINRRPTDGFIKAYDQHEDSVYSVAWSHSDIWVFASLSYDGRVVINRVPTSEKFKILGI